MHLSTALQDGGPSDDCKCSCAQALRKEAKWVQDRHHYNSQDNKAILKSLKGMIALAHVQNSFLTSRCSLETLHRLTDYSSSNTLNEKLPDWTYSATSLCLQCLEADPNMEKDCKHKEKPNVSYSWITNSELDSLFTF